MSRRSTFIAMSVLAFMGAIGAFVRGQYLDWDAARIQFAAEHSEAPVIDVEPKRDGWLLDSGLTQASEVAGKQNAAGHFRTMAAILAATGLAAGYWGWVKCPPPSLAEDAVQPSR